MPQESALTQGSISPLPAQAAEVVPFTSGNFCVPPHELGEFQKLTDADKERILLLDECFKRMASGNVVAQSHAIALQLSHLRGYSAANIRALYYAFKEHGWRALVRGYKGPQEVPEAFRQWFRSLCLQNSRSIRTQIGIVQRLWREGESIPGYGTWQEWFLTKFPDRDIPRACPGFPKGWSESNLYTIQPPKAERALKTRGYATAKKYLPSVIRDTSELRPLELIVIDDFEADQLCIHENQVVRVSGIAALDVATRRKLALGMKPRIENEETGRKESIQRREVRYMLYCLLAEWGMPCGYPITILCENASAAIEHELETAFGHLFGGRIRVTRTGIIDCRTVANGFTQGGGKPWEKGWIESAFNMMANIAAVLPGQKGASYQKKPAELAAKILYAERMLSDGEKGLNLTPAQRTELKLPFRSRDELIDAYEVIFSLMDHRTNHKMLGFDQVQEWRRDGAETWQPITALAALSDEEQVKVQIASRPESPIERWEKLNSRPDCKREKIADHVLAALLLTPKEATLRNGRVTFTHKGKGYTFADAAAYALNEREGEKVLCYFDENAADVVHVYGAKGNFIQSIRRLGPADITNPASVAAAIATVKTIENQAFASVKSLTLDEARENAGMIANNERVAPGVHLDSSIRRSLGLKVAEAKELVTPALPKPEPVSLTKALAQGKVAGPLARDAFAGAESVSSATVQHQSAKAKADALRGAEDYDAEQLL